MSDDEGLGDIFQEPPDYFQPEKPATFDRFRLKSGDELTVRLVGNNPLWGHLLWNAARVCAEYLEDHADRLIKDKNVLELGAGAGLPSLVCAIHGAKKVIVSDYPDQPLIDNLAHNIATCATLSPAQKAHSIHPVGYIWGQPPTPLTALLDPPPAATAATPPPGPNTNRFELLILADLVFNHYSHPALLQTVLTTLRRDATARALVFFTPHRPKLLGADLAFFDLARDAGLEVEPVVERYEERGMFEEEDWEEAGGARRLVLGFEIGWGSAGEPDAV